MAFVTAEPFLPGEYIKDEMEARDWTQDDLAEVMQMSRRHVINLIQGKSGITAETAHRLASAFGGQTAETWINLQTSYDLALAAKTERDTRRRAKVFEKMPIRELRRRAWIADVTETAELEDEVCSFLSIQNIDDTPSINVAARKSTSYEFENASQVAWYCRARQLAERVKAAKYSESNFGPGLSELLQLASSAEGARRVPAAIAEMGIRLVIVEHLQKTKIDGAAFWLDETSPVIAMSLRYDRIDYFWFTLLHEMIHVKYRDVATVDVDVAASQADETMPDFEQRANTEAADSLVSKARLDSFVARNRPHFYQKKIVQFAQARQVHPGIVVGQLHNRGVLSYQRCRKLLEKVRSHVIGQAITDGWESR